MYLPSLSSESYTDKKHNKKCVLPSSRAYSWYTWKARMERLWFQEHFLGTTPSEPTRSPHFCRWNRTKHTPASNSLGRSRSDPDRDGGIPAAVSVPSARLLAQALRNTRGRLSVTYDSEGSLPSWFELFDLKSKRLLSQLVLPKQHTSSIAQSFVRICVILSAMSPLMARDRK